MDLNITDDWQRQALNQYKKDNKKLTQMYKKSFTQNKAFAMYYEKN